MDHEALKSKLYEFYDGELPPPEAQAFARHVLACGECRAEIDAWKEAAQAFLNEAPIPAPKGFSARVMARIMEKEAAQAPVRASIFDLFALPRWEAAAAFCASLLVLFYFSFDYIQLKNGSVSNPIALFDSAGESEKWLVLSKLEKDDALGMAVGEESQDESATEVSFHE